MKATNEIIMQSVVAAETVTGSKHLVQTLQINMLIECSLLQGIKSLRMKNQEELPVHHSDIDELILTHAHFDHCGYIPLIISTKKQPETYYYYRHNNYDIIKILFNE